MGGGRGECAAVCPLLLSGATCRRSVRPVVTSLGLDAPPPHPHQAAGQGWGSLLPHPPPGAPHPFPGRAATGPPSKTSRYDQHRCGWVGRDAPATVCTVCTCLSQWRQRTPPPALGRRCAPREEARWLVGTMMSWLVWLSPLLWPPPCLSPAARAHSCGVATFPWLRAPRPPPHPPASRSRGHLPVFRRERAAPGRRRGGERGHALEWFYEGRCETSRGGGGVYDGLLAVPTATAACAAKVLRDRN